MRISAFADAVGVSRQYLHREIARGVLEGAIVDRGPVERRRGSRVYKRFEIPDPAAALERWFATRAPAIGKCRACGGPFTRTGQAQRFCSVACRERRKGERAGQVALEARRAARRLEKAAARAAVHARAIAMRRDGYRQAEIAAALGRSVQSIQVWTVDAARGSVGRKIRPARERMARLLRDGFSPEEIAAITGFAIRTIQVAIEEGELPAWRRLVACSACGVEHERRGRNALGNACSDRCRRALANASKVVTRWRKKYQTEPAPVVRELVTARALLRIETAQHDGGNDGN